MTIRTHITILIAAIAITAFLIGIATQANAQSWCPEGHQLVVDKPGPYYLYSPNEPAGYSAIWVNDSVTLIPPIGQYGTPEDHIRVCYTDNIHAYAESIGRTPTPPAPDLRCWVDGEEGIKGATGECWTPTLYDQVFSYDNLSQIPHQGDPTISVAQAAGLQPDTDRPSQRPRTFTYDGGVTLYESFGNVVAGIHA